MLLLLLLLNPNTDKVVIEFEDGVQDFEEFEKVFKALSLTDSLCSKLIAHLRSQDEKLIKVKSEVSKLSKSSPFELTAFVTDHWFEILLFVYGSYDRIRPNAHLIYKDVAHAVSALKEIGYKSMDNAKEFSSEKMTEVIEWFNDLSQKERERIIRIIKQSKILQKIKSIKFERGGAKIG